MLRISYIRARTTDEARSVLSAARRPKGGGVELLDLAKRGVSTPEAVVDVRAAIPAVIVAQPSGGLRIGATATLSALASSADVLRHAPLLADAAREAATPQIRNVATVAGNLLQRPRCAYFRDPFFDCLKRGGMSCPARIGVHDEMAIFGNAVCCATHPSNLATALLAAGAELSLVRPDPRARVVAIDRSFFVAPDEDPLREARLAPDDLVEAVVCPPSPASAYAEANQKQSFDWASVAAAVVLDVEGGKISDARIALGAVSPVPIRAEAAEAALAGKGLRDEKAWDAAAAAATEGATPLPGNVHKVRQLRAVVRRAIAAAAARSK